MLNEIRAVLIPTAKERKLLLPNAMVAEVMTYREPDPVKTGADWVIGTIDWRGSQLYVIDFARLTHAEGEDSDLASKNIAVIKTINYADKLSHFAVVSKGIPKLQLVSRGDMQLHEDRPIKHNAIASLVSVQEETADIPNMNYLESNIIAVHDQA